MKLNRKIFITSLLALTLVLSGCDSDDDDDGAVGAGDNSGVDSGDTDGDTDSDADGDTDSDTDGDTDSGAGDDTATDGDADTGSSATARAVVASIDAGFTSSVIDLVDVAAPFAVEGELNPGVSDTIVRAFGDRYFVIRRFMSDSIAAYSVDDPSTPLYEVSTNSETEDVSSNPHDLIFLNAEKAYLLRYGSPIMWIVNPSATDPADFRIGEIDLSVYDADGVPEATRGAIVGDRLFIVMQRLQNFAPTQPGAVAVIDTTTDTEIDTGSSNEFPGIELPAFNPSELSVDTSSDTLLISAQGDFGAFDGSRPPALTGGLVALDATDFSVSQLIDDNDGTGRMINVEVASASVGYLVTSTAFDVTSLDQFNPVTGNIDALGVAGLSGVDIRDIATGPAGNLWIAVADPVAPRIVIIDPTDNSVVADEIATTLNPTNIVFTE